MIAGDVRVSLAIVELLTTRIGLLVSSIGQGWQIGLNWRKQRSASHYAGPRSLDREAAPECAGRYARLSRSLTLRAAAIGEDGSHAGRTSSRGIEPH